MNHLSSKSHRIIRATLALKALLSLAFLGCAQEPSSGPSRIPAILTESDSSEIEIREVNRRELQELVATSDKPVLVEFSVLSGCYRCDDMRSPIRHKASELLTQADVVRIDFNLNAGFARDVGATVCPSYVVYSEGDVFRVRTWPTSADFVAEDVMSAVNRSRDSNTTGL